jgi:hypothetical protein
MIRLLDFFALNFILAQETVSSSVVSIHIACIELVVVKVISSINLLLVVALLTGCSIDPQSTTGAEDGTCYMMTSVTTVI